MKKMLAALVLLAAITLPAAADTIHFDLSQVGIATSLNADFTQYVNLSANPTIMPYLWWSAGDRMIHVCFLPGITLSGPSTGHVQYDWLVGTLTATTFNNLSNYSASLVGGGSTFVYQTIFYLPTPAQVRITVLDGAGISLGSAVYSFTVLEPVPEPATLLLVLSGLLFARRKRP